MNTDLIKIKEIKFLEGILTFKVPLNWIEEYEDSDVGVMYYADSPASGTMRVRLLTMKSPESITFKNIRDVLKSVNGEMINLPNKNAYKYYYEETIDSDHQITNFYWSLTQIIKPYKVRLVNFFYTILFNQRNVESVQKEVSFIINKLKMLT